MGKKNLLFLFFFILNLNSNAFELKYILNHLTNTTTNPVKVCIDNENNIIVGGTFTGTVDFDLSEKEKKLSPINNSASMYIAKYSSHGKLLFAINFNSNNSYNIVKSIKTDKNNNIYILGEFIGTIDLDPGNGTKTYKSYTNNVSNLEVDLFLSKFSPQGRFLWGNRFGGSNWDSADDLEIDKNNNIYYTATFRDTVRFGNTYIYIDRNSYRCPYLVKLKNNGDFIWVRHIIANNNVLSNDSKNSSIVVDDTLNIYMTGYSSISLTLNYNSYDSKAFTFYPYYEDMTYIQKLDSNGNLKFGKIFNGRNYSKNGLSPSLCRGKSIGLDKKNNIIIGGDFEGRVDFNTSESDSSIIKSKNKVDCYFAKLNQKGEALWVKTFGGNGSENLKSMYFSYNGDISLYGTYDNAFYYKKSYSDSIIINPNGYKGIFFITLDSNINYKYSNYFNHLNSSFNKYVHAFDIILNDKQNYYLTGYYDDSMDFKITKKNVIKKSGSFFAKITTCKNTFDTIDVTNCFQYTSPSKKYIWTSSGLYNDTISNYLECDSILSVNLTIIPKSTTTINQKICNGSFLSPSGKYTYFKSGLYFDTIKGYYGCDSFLKINLKVDTTTFSSIKIQSCNDFLTPSKKYVLKNTGLYKDTLKNNNNCDSIISIDFKRNSSSSFSMNISTCKLFQSPSRKYIWSQSGTYYDTIKNYTNCDSFMTIHLFIYKNITDTIDIDFCNSYESPSRRKVWKKEGVFLDTFLNYLYCDSIVAFRLKSNKSFASFQVESCENYILPSNKKVTESGIYKDSISNYLNCDSVIIFNLKITKINNKINLVDSLIVSQEDSADSYQWFDCQNNRILTAQNNRTLFPIKNGIYKTIISKNNCIDSSECFVYNVLSLQKPLLPDIKLYPSPTNQFLNVVIPSNIKPTQIIIFNSLNQIVFSENTNENYLKLKINYSPGIYFLKIVAENQNNLFFKFIVN